MMTRTFRCILLSTLTLLFVSTSFAQSPNSESSTAPSTDKPWKIGGVVALTGAASGWGEMARSGW